jgi:two-component system sensor histidine kinase KdpD
MFILGVLFVAKYTEGYLSGIVAAFCGVLLFNFFFTEPFYSFTVHRNDYPITFLIMLIAALITSTSTTKIKREIAASNVRESRLQFLYKINNVMMKARSIRQIIDYCGNELVKIFHREIIIGYIDPEDKIVKTITIELSEKNQYYKDHTYNKGYFEHLITEGIESPEHSNVMDQLYQEPIVCQHGIQGTIGVLIDNEVKLTSDEMKLLKSVTSQIALAIEKDLLNKSQKEASLIAELEKLRGNLLRSITHDLRTPLTAILGSVSTIIENYKDLTDEKMINLIHFIYTDTNWLIQTVENVLSMTKIDEGMIKIEKKNEMVDEVIAEAIQRTKRFSPNHKFGVEIEDEIDYIYVDSSLFGQVLINLLDNARKFSDSDNEIVIKVSRNQEKVVFKIIDNGSGIDSEILDMIFDRYYSHNRGLKLERRGIGLGLAICKSIIEVHGGEIKAYNNDYKGATFEFYIPGRITDGE